MCWRVDDLRVRGLCQCKHTGTGGEGVSLETLVKVIGKE
jgi:hypothetical protein